MGTLVKNGLTRNAELRLYAKRKRVNLWEIAEKIGVADATLSRKLRKEFSEEDKKKFKAIVDEIAEKMEDE